jgi:5-methyltetrahydrofolate--homocysteine methyltransferase
LENLMTNALGKLLETADAILADGATGTNLFNMGLQSGDAPELWNVDAPDKIRALYQGSVDAGSDLFLTNTFGGTAARLKLHDAHTRVAELNRAGAELGREVADKAGRLFHEQAEALKAGGADVLWLETISAPEEFRAAAEAFALADMPWCGTMSFDTAGRTMMGVTSSDLAQLVETLPNPPMAFGANCGTGASDILRTVLGFAAQGTERPLISKGNAGIPKYVDGHIHYDGTPELMGQYAAIARDSGATIIGGCCGTMPEHLRKMRDALDNTPRAERPTLDQITDALGPFTSASDGTNENAAPERRTRRRRRA